MSEEVKEILCHRIEIFPKSKEEYDALLNYIREKKVDYNEVLVYPTQFK